MDKRSETKSDGARLVDDWERGLGYVLPDADYLELVRMIDVALDDAWTLGADAANYF
jgi:hypothetical protein